MLRTIEPGEMRRIERRAFDAGVPSLLLMEAAARAVFSALCARMGEERGGRVLFACGAGNNGGDALAAARLYALDGGEAVVWLPRGAGTPDAQKNLAYLRQLDGVTFLEGALPEDALVHARFAVDGLLGTGLRGAPEEDMARAIRVINAQGARVIAVDVPSGMDALTGSIADDLCVRAEATVTFHRPKQGLYLTRRREYAGDIVLADIGLPPRMDDAPGIPAYQQSDLAALLPPRSRDAHKGDCGRVVIYAGSLGMAGAAAMAGKACLRAGAGLVTMICPEDIMQIMQITLPNAMCMDRAGIPARVPPHHALLFGCGIWENEPEWADIQALFDPALPSVWDAGALNLLARHPMTLGDKAVITPHAAEAARLLHCDLEAILCEPLRSARELSARYGCTAALKGATTVIAGAGGDIALNVVGTPALAKGGSGDALAGVIAALLCEMPPFAAARTGCLWHGVAGLRAEKKHGVRGALTGEVIDELY